MLKQFLYDGKPLVLEFEEANGEFFVWPKNNPAMVAGGKTKAEAAGYWLIAALSELDFYRSPESHNELMKRLDGRG